MAISAWFRALGTARHLHKPVCLQRSQVPVGADLSDQYFQVKGMTPEQVSVFMEERKWDYRGMEVCVPITSPY